MIFEDDLPLRGLDEDAALRTILEGTSTETGERFFQALVQNLAKALKTHGAWVTEYLPESRRLRALAFWMGGQWVQGYEQHIDGTPCAEVIDAAQFVHFPDNVLTLYPDDPDIKSIGAVSYMGAPLVNLEGKILGHLAVLDTRPIPENPRVHTLFRIFAARASAEVQRLRAERDVLEREQKLAWLVSTAMDAIIELDQELRITRMNAAGEKAFQCTASQVLGQSFAQFLSEEARQKLTSIMRALDSRPDGARHQWIPEGLKALCPGGVEFPAEASVSRYEINRYAFYTLILRNRNECIAAEKSIDSLTSQAGSLREEIEALHNFESIVGRSAAILRVLRDVSQVAETDASVLILGETGTGKELVARAIHAAGRRRDKSLIKVNCAALPATLIESELFGHEKGAFTGASTKRDGRFTLADGGTIFLDEIGELPLDLQAKLLRVLQEGEFEPIGSARTRHVDVRVLAATNRDLLRASRERQFREDLYYRLNVFPIEVPALRERSEDIPLLASTFAEGFARQLQRSIAPLSEECIRRLRAYSWPGNVRELQNVIERAVITAQDGRLNLDRALPKADIPSAQSTASHDDITRVLTIRELEELERKNLVAALQVAQWRVSGETGAARLLGMNPSTLTSRMKALGISRPVQN